MFNEKEIARCIDEISLFDEVKLNDIPDIELYVDQVYAFIDKKLSHLKRNDKDKLLTKTMINNYTKAGLLMPPLKKKYSRQHIALLILVYYSKQILSINDISILCSFLLRTNPEEKRNYEDRDAIINDFYNLTQEINNNDLYDLKAICENQVGLIKAKTSELDNEEKESMQWALLVMFLVSQAAMQKRLAEKIIDQYLKKDAPIYKGK